MELQWFRKSQNPYQVYQQPCQYLTDPTPSSFKMDIENYIDPGLPVEWSVDRFTQPTYPSLAHPEYYPEEEAKKQGPKVFIPFVDYEEEKFEDTYKHWWDLYKEYLRPTDVWLMRPKKKEKDIKIKWLRK